MSADIRATVLSTKFGIYDKFELWYDEISTIITTDIDNYQSKLFIKIAMVALIDTTNQLNKKIFNLSNKGF